MMKSTDENLLLLDRYARTGDAEAFAELVRRYRNMVYAACLRVLNNAADAEDVTQECFLSLVRRRSEVKRSVGGWLHRCATGMSLNARRRRDARRKREENHMAPSNGEPAWDEVAPDVDEALDALPDDLREVLVEHYLRERTQVEIAGELGVSPATVSRRVSDAVERLRRNLKKAGVIVSTVALAAMLSEKTAVAAPAALAAELGKMAMAGAGRTAGTAFLGAKAIAVIAAVAVCTSGVIAFRAVSARKAAAVKRVRETNDLFRKASDLNMLISERSTAVLRQVMQTHSSDTPETAEVFRLYSEYQALLTSPGTQGDDRFARRLVESYYDRAAFCRGIANYESNEERAREFREKALPDFFQFIREARPDSINKPDNARYWTAKILKQLGRKDEAARMFSYLAEHSQLFAPSWMFCEALQLVHSVDSDEFHRQLSEYLETHPPDKYFHPANQLLAMSYLATGKPALAIPIFRDKVLNDPAASDDAQAYNTWMLGKAYFESGDDDKGMETYNIVIERWPDYANGLRVKEWIAARAALAKAWRDRKVTFNFIETPFLEAIAAVQRQAGVEIALDPEGADLRHPEVTLKVTDMKASQALDWICKQVGLTWVAKPDNTVVLMTPSRAIALECVTRVYDIAGILDPTILPKWHEPITHEEVIDFITHTMAPGTWGGKYGTSITCQDGKLTVVHREETQGKVAKFLDSWRLALRWGRARLGKKATFAFDKTPLPEAVAFLAKATQAKITLDDERIPPGLEVTLNGRRMELGTTLNKIGRACRLVFLVRDDYSILLTTPEHALELAEPVRLEFDVQELMKDPPPRLRDDPNGPGHALGELVKDSIAPGTWGEPHRTAIEFNGENGMLVVTHVTELRGQVRDLIDGLRGAKPKQEIPNPLAGKIATLDCHDTPLRDVVAFLSETTHAKIVLDEKNVPPGLQVTLTVFEADLGGVLDRICGTCRLKYIVYDDRILITTPEEALRLDEPMLKLYDISDLMDAPPPALANHPKGPGEAMVELVRQTIAPGTWEEKEHTLRHHNGRLIVSHTREVHRQVAKLLEELIDTMEKQNAD